MQYLQYGLLFCFKQQTAYEMRISDWSSDVCSSDLDLRQFSPPRRLSCGDEVPEGSARLLLHRELECRHQFVERCPPKQSRTRDVEERPRRVVLPVPIAVDATLVVERLDPVDRKSVV